MNRKFHKEVGKEITLTVVEDNWRIRMTMLPGECGNISICHDDYNEFNMSWDEQNRIVLTQEDIDPFLEALAEMKINAFTSIS